MDNKKLQNLTKQHFEGIFDPRDAAKELVDKLEIAKSKMEKTYKKQVVSFYDLYIAERTHVHVVNPNQMEEVRKWGALASSHSYDELIHEGIAAYALEIIKKHIHDKNIDVELQHSESEFISYVQIKASVDCN